MENTGGKIRSVAILCNINKKGVGDVASELVGILDSLSVKWHIDRDAARAMGLEGFERAKLPDVDLVISLGGDGTMLTTARMVGEREIPVLGINMGRLGFLTELDTNEIESSLPDIIEGDYYLDSRMMLEVDLPGNNHRSFALNEFVLDRGQSPRLIQLQIFVSGYLVAEVSADGVIVSTPTGSTAYNMSAGGAIMSPDMEAFQITALSPYTLSIRPVIVGPHEEIRVIYEGDREWTPRNSLDGQPGRGMPDSGEIVIRKAPFSAHFVHYHRRSFYDVLHRKLGWATPPGRTRKDAI